MRKLLCILLGLLFLLPNLASAVEPGFIVYHGDRAQKRIAITVDDCYNLACLQDMLDMAKEFDIPLTFFVLGSMLHEEDRALWQAVVDGGHEIGNHSFGHPNLANIQPRAAMLQLTRTQDALDAALGYHYPMQMMRPPYGSVRNSAGASISNLVEKCGYQRIILWDVSQTDPAKAIHNVQPGSILLYHTNPKDYNCLLQLIPALKERGYTFHTVSDLLGFPQPSPQLSESQP